MSLELSGRTFCSLRAFPPRHSNLSLSTPLNSLYLLVPTIKWLTSSLYFSKIAETANERVISLAEWGLPIECAHTWFSSDLQIHKLLQLRKDLPLVDEQTTRWIHCGQYSHSAIRRTLFTMNIHDGYSWILRQSSTQTGTQTNTQNRNRREPWTPPGSRCRLHSLHF